MGNKFEKIITEINKITKDRESESEAAVRQEVFANDEIEDKLQFERKEKKQELQEMVEYSNEINKIVKKYDSLFFIEPQGGGGRSYEEEFKLFYEKIKDNLKEDKYLSDEDYRDMCPEFTYPEIKKLDQGGMEKAMQNLDELGKRLDEECRNENVKTIISDLLRLGRSKVDFHEHFAKGEMDREFEDSKVIYGDIDDDLCKRAKDVYAEKIDFLKKKQEKSDLEKKLEESEFGAQDIRTYFELAIIKAGLSDSGYKVIIDGSVNNIRVSTSTPKYDHPVVLIPPDKTASGMNIIKLCAHEIGRHVTTNIYSKKQGLEGAMGEGWNIVNEGISKRSESEAKKEVLQESFNDYEIDADPYYILAMEKIRGEKNNSGEYENGWNYAKTFKYIHDLSLEEYLSDAGYYRIKEKARSDSKESAGDLEIKLEKIKAKSEKNAVNTAKRICLRTFKGFDPRSGGKYLAKDKIYFEGEAGLLDLERAGSIEEFEKYLRLSKVDPKFIPYLLKMEAYTYDKGLKAAKDVAKTIWEDLELPNKEVLQGNRDYELFLPYFSEFMERYYKDELYNLYDKKDQQDEQ